MHSKGMTERLTLVRSVVSLAFHARQRLGYPLEQRLDVVANLGRRLNEHEVVLLGLLFTLLSGDLALVVQIRLVANEDDDDIGTPLSTDVVDPLPRLLERLLTGNVVDDDGNTRVANVRRNQTPEALLACRVPEL